MGLSGPQESFARNDKIKALWAEGNSAGKIAVDMSMTRNAVMGVLFRAQRKNQAERRKESPVRLPSVHMGVYRHPKVTAGKAAREKKPPARSVLEQPAPCSPQAPLRYDWLDLPSGGSTPWHNVCGCTYLLEDEPAHPLWCNAPVAGKTSWCEFHLHRVARLSR
jgi:hypothetical protein